MPRFGTLYLPSAERAAAAGLVAVAHHRPAHRFPWNEFHPAPLIVQVVSLEERHAHITSKDCSGSRSGCRGRRSHGGVARHSRSEMAWWRMARGWMAWRLAPRRLGLGRVRLGFRTRIRDRIRCALLRWVPLLRLWRRLRHAPPVGDQPVGSSRSALDPRLLLDAPFGRLPAGLPGGGRAASRISPLASHDR